MAVEMNKSPWKNVPNVGIEHGATCMPSEHASDWATGLAWIEWRDASCPYFILPVEVRGQWGGDGGGLGRVWGLSPKKKKMKTKNVGEAIWGHFAMQFTSQIHLNLAYL